MGFVGIMGGADDTAIGINDHQVWDGTHLISIRHDLCTGLRDEQLCPWHLLLIHSFLPRLLAVVNRDAEDVHLVTKFLIHLLDTGDGHAARPAPRCPEVDEIDLSLLDIVGELLLRAVGQL